MKNTKNQIENSSKDISKEDLIKLASESVEEEMKMQDFQDMKYQQELEEFLKNNPGSTEDDFKLKIIGIDLAKGPIISRKNLLEQLENEYPRVFRLYKNTLPKIKTIDLKKMMDNLDKDRVPFGDGGSSNGHNKMNRSDFLKLPFTKRVEALYGINLKGDEKLSEIQILIDGLEPILDIE